MKNISTKKEYKNKNAGFTIIEAMIAILVLLIAVVAPLSIITSNLNSTFFARDEVIATYLAQEGVEIIRQRRDSNFINIGSGVVWDNGFTSCESGCRVDGTKITLGVPTISPCISGACEDLYLDPNGFYTHDADGTVGSNFSRNISTKYNTDRTEILVTVNVSFQTGRRVKTVTVEDYLRKWLSS